MATRARFKKLTDLYVQRREVKLADGEVIYVRALNAFERDQCLDAAQIARSRVVMALKEAGEEALKVQARHLEVGREAIAKELAQVKVDDNFGKIALALRDDPDWKERLEILERTDFDDEAHQPSDEEVALIARINADYMAEVDRRREEELRSEEEHNLSLSEEELLDDYVNAWLDKKGRKVASDEYLCTEIQLATVYPDGEKVFASKAEVRECPAELFDAIAMAVNELLMDVRDPKDLGSDQSSSKPSPPLSVEEV